MFSYLAFVWDSTDPAARQTARLLGARLSDSKPSWQKIVGQDGLEVFQHGARPGSSEAHVLDNGVGVVLGRLFMGTQAAPTTFNASDTAAIVKTGARHLIEHYWGRYVAFVRDAASATTWILRDPSVGMPCLTTHYRGVDLYFSRMEDVVALGVGPFTLNWSYIGAHLCAQILEIPESGLNEVSRVLGGECVESRRGQNTRAFYWDPFKISERNIIPDPKEATEALRQTTRDCVHAWASGHSQILHTLSGGLDSSIVLACLKDAPSRPNITCVNYYSPGADSDERSYAQSAARHLGFELFERPRDGDLRLESLLNAPRSAYPVNCRYYLENSHWEAALAQEKQATAIFCGEGGDQIFYQSRANFGAGDYLCRQSLLGGLNSDLLRVALDCARLDRRSVWHVLKDALKQKYLGERWRLQDDLGKYRKLLPEALIDAVRGHPTVVHPLLRTAGRVPSGKRWQVFQMLFPAMDFYDPLGLIHDTERVIPLWSQPLMALCLRIPVDVLTVGGWDRAIARRAFQHALPRKVAIRRTKGGLDEYSKGILSRNMPFMRDFLLNGALIREKLIDRQKVETVLSDNPSRVGGDSAELFELANTEAWIRNWESRK